MPTHTAPRTLSALVVLALLALTLGVAAPASATLGAPGPTREIACTGGPGVVVAGFELDGNLCVDHPADTDWDQVVTGDSATTVSDGFGDSTGFTDGAAENTDPAGWVGGHATNDKADIGDAYATSRTVGGNVYAFFGITDNGTSGGTQQFDLEYNQLPNATNSHGVSAPHRTPGDLLVRFSSNGVAAPDFTDVKRYTLTSDPAWSAGSCFATATSAAFGPAGGWCTYPLNSAAFASATNAGATFIEGSINLSLLFGAGGTCSATYGATNVRSVTGNSFATSSLKDYVAPLEVTTPSTCGSLQVRKQNPAGDLVPGATYRISPDPRPGHTGDVLVTDGQSTPAVTQAGVTGIADPDGTADGVIRFAPAEPRAYTVTEVQAPAGYWLAESRSQTITVGSPGTPDATATVSFTDPHQWQAPTIDKTVSASYGSAYTWKAPVKQVRAVIDGTPEPTWHDDIANINVPAGSNVSFQYRVQVAQDTETRSDWEVHGNIKVHNPNPRSMSVTLADQLSDGTTCTVAGGATTSVPPSAGDPAAAGYWSLYPYTCHPRTHAAGTNTATATWKRADYPTTQAEVDNATTSDTGSVSTTAKSYDFAQGSATGRTVSITDTRSGDTGSFGTPSPAASWPWTITWGDNPDGTYTREYAVPYTGTATGSCQRLDNTVTNATTDQSDDAAAEVCTAADLTVSKNVVESLTRTYPWTLHKSAGSSRVDVDPATGKATASYTVRVQADGPAQDSDWQMSGTATVTNPNGFEPVVLTGLTDSYDGGGTCSVTGWAGMSTAERTVPAGGSKTFGYTCAFATQPTYDGTNTVTATWDKAAAHTPSATATGTKTVATSQWTLDEEADKTVDVYDDNAGVGTPTKIAGPLTWSPGFDQSFTYTRDLTAPSGACQDWTNSAWLTGDGGVRLAQPSSATVTACNAAGMIATKTATPTFTRTYAWSVDKQVSGDGGQTWQDSSNWTGDAFSHDFAYRISVSRHGSTDSAFAMAGSIAVTNPNTDARLGSTLVHVTEPGALGGAAASCTIDGSDVPTLDGTAYVTLAPQTTRTLTYHCALDTRPADGTVNTATVSWGGAGASTTATSGPVSYTAPTTQVHDQVSVVDDMATAAPGDDRTFGPLRWSDAASPVTYGPYTVTHTATTIGCDQGNSWTNTARVLDGATVLASDAATAAICPQAGHYSIAKTSDRDQTVQPGDTITYTLTARQLSNVAPTGVVLTDDVSQVLANADSTGVAIHGPHAGTASVSGDTLTWSIGTLAGTQTLTYSITVKPADWGARFRNAVTSTGSDNCQSTATAECRTTHDTPQQPHLVLVKSVAGNQSTGGTATPADWTLTATPVSGQPAFSGAGRAAADVQPGSYDLSEAPTSDPGPVGYTAGAWSCVRTGTASPYAMADPDTVTLQPADDVTCTITNTAQAPQWTLAKSSDPVSGSTVVPGQVITYTVTARHTGGVWPTGVVVTDDTSRWKTHASLVPGSIRIDGAPAGDAVTTSTDAMQWTIGTLQGTHTLTYQVRVDDDAAGVTIGNQVTAPGSDCPPPAAGAAVADQCSTAHPVPSWTLRKTSDPATGSTVNPGSPITYTLTVTNTSTVLLHGATVVDDLSRVLDHAGLASTFPAGGEAAYDDATQQLVWSVPDVGPGAVTTFSFTVRVDDDVAAVRLDNLATPGPTTDHPVNGTGHCESATACATEHGTPQVEPPTELPPTEVPPTEVPPTIPPSTPPTTVSTPPARHQSVPPAPPRSQAAPGSTPSTLPNTGGPDAWDLEGGLLLVLTGAALVLVDRRRRAA